jgi:hypothetical protein
MSMTLTPFALQGNQPKAPAAKPAQAAVGQDLAVTGQPSAGPNAGASQSQDGVLVTLSEKDRA